MPSIQIDPLVDGDLVMHSHVASDITGLTSHDAVTVTDTSSVDLTLSGQALSAAVIPGGVAHNSLGSLQGGTTGQYYHLTSAQATVVGNTSGTNSGDVTLGTNTATALSLSGQQLSLADKFVQIAGDTMTGPLMVDGSTNVVQLIVQANSTQTTNLTEWQLSDGYSLAYITPNFGFHGLYAELGGTIPGWMDTSLYINKSVGTTVYNSYAASFTYSIYNPGGAITSYGSGITLTVNVNNSGNAVNGEIYGADFTVTNYNDAVLQSAVGGLFRVWNGDGTNATMNKMTGAIYQIKVQDSTVTDVFGLKTDISIDTGTVTSVSGVYIPSATLGSGSLTYNYGVYVESVSVGTNKYAIYTNDGVNRFGDIVNTTASYQVDGVQVVSNRVVDARCDDTINSGDATTDGVIDALRDAMIAHGLIAAS